MILLFLARCLCHTTHSKLINEEWHNGWGEGLTSPTHRDATHLGQNFKKTWTFPRKVHFPTLLYSSK